MDTGEVVTRIYEVRRADRSTCGSAKVLQSIGAGVPRNPGNFPYEDIIRHEVGRGEDKWFNGWETDSFAFEICESWKTREVQYGGLGGGAINFKDGGWPLPNDQYDICNNMNRSDTIFEMETYWLYNDNISETSGTDFWRG
jgi:hypothetical protein